MTEEELKKAVDKYFSDQSRTAAETRAGLEALISHAEILIESLPE